ncbi:hypothetical protein GIB67_030547 [Kingdonia uniflora]|uniref:Uncharacterized protein n=1 Tax=Kingdonia uniflora TaxID=39325 RepID=A0A7J7L6Q2_9MAGN|nr:hypothetical protein GIB67_030547 [Kingdonia uniflora]
MGRRPCCSKEGLKRGAWTALEDRTLKEYIQIHGEGGWRNLPIEAGLKRCGKSCRLRWLNYLRPDIKRGNISEEEEDLIIRLHKLLGNRILINPTPQGRVPPPVPTTESRVVLTKATRCTKVFFTQEEPGTVNEFVVKKAPESDGLLSDLMADLDVGGLCLSEFLHSDFSDLRRFDDNNAICLDGNNDNNNDLFSQISSDDPLLFYGENIEQYWTGVDCIQRDAAPDLQSLAIFLDAEEELLGE